MRLATWNVEYARGPEKNRLRRELLLQADADVWVLTETHDELVLTEAYQSVRASARSLRPGGRWSYANLAMACAAVEKGAIRYQPVHYMIRARLHRGLVDESMSIGSLPHDERLKMNLPRACAYCGGGGRLSLDHLVPRARGGGDEADNVIWACSPCNSSKGALDLLAWFAGRESFPPLYLLRRYLKLAFAWAEEAGVMGCDLGELGEAPFAIEHVPLTYPPPSGLVLWVAPLAP